MFLRQLLPCGGTGTGRTSPSSPTPRSTPPEVAFLSPREGSSEAFRHLQAILQEFSKPCFGLVPFGILKRKIMRGLRLIKIQNSTTPAKTTLLVPGWLLRLLYVCDKNWLGLAAERCGYCHIPNRMFTGVLVIC